MKVLCLDIGGTDLKYGMVEDGHILEKGVIPSLLKIDFNKFQENLINVTKSFLAKYDFTLAGVGCPGCINPNTGIIINPPEHEKILLGFNFKKFFKNHFNLTCYADNDVNCFALAEQKVLDESNFIMMTVGTGIGGAIVIDHQLYRGEFFQVGEFGRMIFGENTWENEVSVYALVKKAQALNLDVKNGQEVYALKDQGNEIAIKLIDAYYDKFAKGIYNLIVAFNPKRIIIGGGVTKRGSFVNELQPYLEQLAKTRQFDYSVIQRSYYQNDGGIVGAYYLVEELMKW